MSNLCRHSLECAKKVLQCCHIDRNLKLECYFEFTSVHLKFIIFFLSFHGLVMVILTGKQIHEMWCLCRIKNFVWKAPLIKIKDSLSPIDESFIMSNKCKCNDIGYSAG